MLRRSRMKIVDSSVASGVALILFVCAFSIYMVASWLAGGSLHTVVSVAALAASVVCLFLFYSPLVFRKTVTTPDPRSGSIEVATKSLWRGTRRETLNRDDIDRIHIESRLVHTTRPWPFKTREYYLYDVILDVRPDRRVRVRRTASREKAIAIKRMLQAVLKRGSSSLSRHEPAWRM
jgi:hypothetical protein